MDFLQDLYMAIEAYWRVSRWLSHTYTHSWDVATIARDCQVTEEFAAKVMADVRPFTGLDTRS